MASNFLPQIFGQETEPSPAIQNSLAGQAAANVAARKNQLAENRQQIAESLQPQQSQLVPQTGPQQPAQQPQNVVSEFVPRQRALDPNTIIARRPGGMVTVPTATTVRSQQPTAGEIAANADVTEQEARLVGAQQELMDQQANWVAKKAEVQEKLVGIEEQSQARRAEIETQRNQAVQDGLTKISTLSEELRGREVKNFWADKSTPQKIIAAIAVGIGGAVQAMRGGSNASMDIINSAIENDLIKQKTNLAKGFDDLREQRTLLGETSKLYDSKIVAEEAARVAGYRAVANELDVMASKAQSDEMKAQINALSEQVKMKAAEREQTFQQSLRSDVVQNYQTKIIPSKDITVGDVIGAQAKQQGQVDYREMAKDKDAMKRYVPAYGGFAYDTTDARELRQSAVDRSAARSILKKLMRFREEHGQWNALDPSERAYATALHNEFLSLKKGKSMDDLGVLAGPDLELLLTSAPKPSDIFSFASDRYRAVLDNLNNKERLDIEGRIQKAVNIPGQRKVPGGASTFKAGL